MVTRIGSLFTGAGGLDQGVMAHLSGELAWYAEADPHAARVMNHRHPSVPNLGDLRYVDFTSLECVDVLVGGTPCQDISNAGRRRGLTDGTRSNLWVLMREAINILQPKLVIWENVRGAVSTQASSALEHCPRCMGDHRPAVPLRALGRVLGDLADLRYDTRWACISAADAGAPHKRERIFVAAYPDREPGLQRWQPAACQATGLRPLSVAARRGGALLPTPAVNDMGAGKDEAQWDTWVASMVATQVNGNGHGRSLDIEMRKGSRYAAAIRHWERLTRPAPPMTVDKNGAPKTNPRFVEWMMGFADGWITDTPGMARRPAMRILGNACSPQQAHLALMLLLQD